jgi:EAL and modified HD-GYP domain-containing signal transduction protein
VRLVTLLVMVWLGEQRPRPLLDTVLIRARFCERLTARISDGDVGLEGFLVGAWSLLDALVNEPLADVLARIRPPDHMTAACLHGTGPLGRVLALVRGYEHADWAAVREGSSALAVDGGTLGPLYLDCLAWARDVLHGSHAATHTSGW